MDINIIIASIIGVILGGVIVFFVKNKKSADVSVTSVDSSNSKKNTKTKQKSFDPNQIAENKKLKNEIDDLEDEIDDLEKEKKKIREEKNKIEDQLYETNKEKEKLSKEKEELTQEKEKTENSLKEKEENITFISDILSAKSSSNKDFEEITKKVNNIVGYVSDNIIDFFEDKKKKEIKRRLENWRNLELKPWIKNKRVIAIVGEFSAGKTSIVNRILQQDDPEAVKLPVNSKETTAIPTYISKGVDFNSQFYSPDKELKNITKETFQNVTKSITDKINISPLIKYFVLSYNNEKLQDLSILDTPGFASNSNEIIKKTTEVVKEADALFWIIDANTGDINQTSIEVMQKHLNDIPIYFVINKIDTKSPPDRKLLEDKIKETAKKHNIPYKEILQFSIKEDVNILMDSIHKIAPKQQENIIEDINVFLVNKIKEFQTEIKDLRKEKKETNETTRQVEANLKIIEEDISDGAERVYNIPEFKSPIFSSDKYQISLDKMEEFGNNLEHIHQKSKQIVEQVEERVLLVKKEIETNQNIEMCKRHKEHFEKTYSDFTKKVNDYNNREENSQKEQKNGIWFNN